MSDDSATLSTLPIHKLTDHPDNPRLQLREDVVERLSAKMATGGFGPEHAVLVRPIYIPKLDEPAHFQIASGHHRVAAAKRAGLDAVPCWVKEMDDDEAFMQLVLSNTQGELSPLEYGMHALTWDTASGQAGQGIASYAEQVGLSKQQISQLRKSAEVAQAVWSTIQVGVLLDRATHLYEISRAPRETWPILVRHLVNREWSVADTTEHVSVLRQFDIPEQHQSWLPLTDVMLAYLEDSRFDPGKVTRIADAADGVLKWIANNAEQLDRDEFTNWLHRQGRDAWDARSIDGWLVNLIGRVRERQLTPEIRSGDFRDTLADLPEGSVDLILTDPPYGDDAVPSYERLAAFASRKLKPGGSLVCYTGQSILPDVLVEMRKHLRYWWTLSLDHNHGGQQLPGKWVMVEWKPLVWFVRDERSGQSYVADKVRGTKPDKDVHEWAQGIGEVFYLVEQLTRPDDLIVDPFAGSGAFGRAALSLGRRFIGADLDPESSTGQIVA